MLIGILSDSHGRAARTGAAVRLLRDRGAELLIHLGDFETEAVLDELVGHPTRLVFGNCDGNINTLTRHARNMDLIVDHPMGTIEVDGKRICFTHGHFEQLMQQAIDDRADYLLHGHSHELRDERVGGTRIINPGALFRATRYTAGLLDPGRDALEILEVPRDTAAV